MRRMLAVGGAALLSIAVGCGGSDEGDPQTPVEETGNLVGSCDHGGGMCTDMYVAAGVDAGAVYASVAEGCTDRGWTPSPSACPTADRVGTCSKSAPYDAGAAGTVSLQSKDRIYTSFTQTGVAAECGNRGGQWVAD